MPMAPRKADNAATARWREAFSGCTPVLEALAKASDESGQETARLWWVVCMSSRVQECKSPYAAWKSDAAAALPTQLTAEHTETAVRLPTFEPMASCLLDHGESIGVDPAETLNRVEAAGRHQQAAQTWQLAVSEVETLRLTLQQSFLAARNRFALFGAAKPKVALAPTAGDMGIDELRVCQVWMYSLASRLHACRQFAAEFATSAGMTNPNEPLQGYDEDRWVRM